MRNRKIIVFLLLAIVALLSIDFVAGMRGAKSSLRARRTLLSDVSAFDSLSIVRHGNVEVEFAKDPKWRMRLPVSSRIDEATLLKLLDAVSMTPIRESLSESELAKFGETLDDFALDEPPLKLVFSNATETVSISIGVPLPSGDGVYAAVEGDGVVHIMPSSILEKVDVDVNRFRRRRFFDGGAEAVRSFDIRRGSGEVLSFSRNGSGWQMGTKRADAALVAKFLVSFLGAEAEKFVSAASDTNAVAQVSAVRLAGYGLDPDSSVTVSILFSGGTDASLSLGKAADAKSVYALASGEASVVTVPSSLRDLAVIDSSRFVDARLFPIQAEKVVSATLVDGDATLSLSRADSTHWRLESPIAAPANVEAVNRLIERILSLTSADAADSGVSVSLGGDYRPSIVDRGRFAQLLGDLAAFRSLEMTAIPADTVRRMVSTRQSADEKGVAVVFQPDLHAWAVETAPAGSIVSNGGIDAVLRQLSSLKAVRVVRLKVSAAELDGYGMDRPYLTLAVDLNRENAVRRNIIVGAATNGGRFATIGSADALFVISDETVRALSSPLVGEAE